MKSSLTVKFRILLLALAFVTLQGSVLFGTTFEWNVDSNGDWESATNWGFNGNPDPKYPDSDGDLAELGTGKTISITTDLTVTITGSDGITVKTLTFDNADAAYTIAGSKLIIDGAGNSTSNLNVESGSHIISANIVLSANTNFNISGSTSLTVSGDIETTANKGLTKTGAGTLTLTGQNTYTGGTTISAGTININRSGGNALNDITGGHNITINSGGTLLLGSADQINNNNQMTLDGGTFNTGGFNESLNKLTLSSTSTIDLGSGASVLTFNSTTENWAGGNLNITNWSGSISGGGTDQLFFGSNSNGINSNRLAQIRFVNPAGFATGTYGAIQLNSGEIVPIPEPSAMIGAGLLSGLIIMDILRRRKQRREEEAA